jgi:hypothetical protein
VRHVVIHYHLFKNAGSSVDAALKARLPWVTREFDADPVANAAGMAAWLAEEETAQAFSTHTGQLPPPVVADCDVVPVIFARHPLDRIASAYTFERTQRDDGFGATLARNTSLGGYIETRLSMPGDRQCRNFQTSRFAALYADDRPERERAVAAVEALPFVGLVEAFDDSLQDLQGLLGERGFGDLDLVPERHNVSRRGSNDLTQRLADLEAEVGSDLWSRLLEVNADDLALWEAAGKRHANSRPPTRRSWWRRSSSAIEN